MRTATKEKAEEQKAAAARLARLDALAAELVGRAKAEVTDPHERHQLWRLMRLYSIEPKLLTVPEAARYLGHRRTSVYREIRAHRLFPTRVRGKVRLRRDELDRYLRLQTEGPKELERERRAT